MKIGLDIHGVIDAAPEFFSELTSALINAENEIHILTGATLKDGKVEKLLYDLNISYSYLFSIVDYNADNGILIEYIDGQPWMDDVLWDKAKGDYCTEFGIDIMIDDTLRYSNYTKCKFLHAKII